MSDSHPEPWHFQPGQALSGQMAGALPQASAASVHDYAGFWRRFLAWFIDACIVVSAGLVLPVVLRSSALNLPGWFLYVTWPLDIGYFAGMESSSWQATLGKRVVGVVVTDLSFQRISFLRATARYFAHAISALLFLIGFLIQPFTSKRQALHDMIAGTLVVRT